ncbi:MAG: hypothetical protein ISN26_07605 [Betaproteobacteria bacterium AqS2]|uniref:Uncharacterized protein n=1 Tax=Candidatus Amphirhobacter heronislandensis TaxID=1732024 RepID=A0A930UE76_9GAMM|nr:hypothetical protein [Betaproteobacteria bacterium AqS2]
MRSLRRRAAAGEGAQPPADRRNQKGGPALPQGRWLQAQHRRLRAAQSAGGQPDKEAGKRVFEEHLAAEKRQLDAKLAALRTRLAAALPAPPWDAEPDVNPHTGKPYKSSKRTRWIAMRFSYPSERRTAVAKATQGRPEVRRQIAAKAKERWKDPAYKKRVGAQISRAHNSPAGQLALAGRTRAHMDAEDGFIAVVANRSRDGAWHRIGGTRDPRRQIYNLRRKGCPGFAEAGDELEVVAAISCRLFHRAAARLHELLGMDAAHKARHGAAVDRPLAAIRSAARRAVAQVDGPAR